MIELDLIMNIEYKIQYTQQAYFVRLVLHPPSEVRPFFFNKICYIIE